LNVPCYFCVVSWSPYHTPPLCRADFQGPFACFGRRSGSPTTTPEGVFFSPLADSNPSRPRLYCFRQPQLRFTNEVLSFFNGSFRRFPPWQTQSCPPDWLLFLFFYLTIPSFLSQSPTQPLRVKFFTPDSPTLTPPELGCHSLPLKVCSPGTINPHLNGPHRQRFCFSPRFCRHCGQPPHISKDFILLFGMPFFFFFVGRVDESSLFSSPSHYRDLVLQPFSRFL